MTFSQFRLRWDKRGFPNSEWSRLDFFPFSAFFYFPPQALLLRPVAFLFIFFGILTFVLSLLLADESTAL